MQTLSLKKIFLASALSLSLLSNVAYVQAAESTAAQQVAGQESLAKVAQQGFEAVNTIQQAREAIFEGMPDQAVQLLKTAADLLKKDSLDWSMYTRTVQSKQSIKGLPVLKDEQYVVINSSLLLEEDFTPSEEQQIALAKISQQIDAGDEKGAIEALRLANIGLDETLVLLPLKTAQTEVAKAQKLLTNKKYYEANIALKSIIDALVADNIAIVVSQ